MRGVKVKGHRPGCSEQTLGDPAELKVGTRSVCRCGAAFFVSFGSGGIGRRWEPVLPPVEPVQGVLELNTVRESATTVYVIVLPGVPPSKNKFDALPPAWKSGQKKAWVKRVIAACEEQMVPKDNPRMGLHAKIVFGTSAARRDPQNYAQQLWNWVPDALVQGGFLVDDNEGRVLIGKNWGLEMAVDLRSGPKKAKERTIIAISVERAVPLKVAE
jgi:hypothetical protein